MKPKPYPPEKRALLSEKRGEVLAFIQELPQNQIRNVALKLQPVPHGFRCGQPAELQQRIRQFVAGIRRWTDKEWDIFQEIWLMWVRCNPELDAVLAKYDNAADFEGEALTPANSSLDIGCFDLLVQASQEWKVSRETIQRFYTFGYFLADERIEQTIRQARPQADFQLLQELAVLKNQVQQIEDTVTSIVAQVETWEKDRRKLDALDDRIETTERQLYDVVNAIRVTQQTTVSLEERLVELEAEAVQIRSEADRHSSKVRSDLEEQRTAIQRVEDQLQQVVHTLTSKIVELNERVATGLNEGDVLSTIQQSDKGTADHRVSESACAVWPIVHSVLVPERISTSTADLRLDTPEMARNALSENLRAIGMQSQAAQALAVEVMAAALAGQAILFRGSIAPIVAEVCARSLAGGCAFRLQIPVGLLDGRLFGAALEELLQEVIRYDRIAALVVEGINLSAPEVYAGRLHRLITERLLGFDTAYVGLLVFGTVVDGAGALPLSLQFSEIGPMFDLDCIVWRNRWPKRRIVGGEILRSTWEAWVDSDGDVPTDWDDVWRESSRFVGPVTPLWRRCVYTAFTRLSTLAAGEMLPTAIQSLAYGWLLPRVISSGTDPMEKRELLPTGVLDGNRSDKRIARLLGVHNEGSEP